MRLTSPAAARRHRGTARRAPRPGTILVELTVVVVILALVVGSIVSIIARQQRVYRSTGVAAAARSQVHQAAGILASELRGLSPAAGDVLEALDSALEIRSTIASGVVCERGADWVALVPVRPSRERRLGGELVPPRPGDLASILVPEDADPEHDRWPSVPIAEVDESGEPCAGGPLIDPDADAGRPRVRLTASVPIPATVRAGAPVRVTRRVRYSLYRSSDRSWYLGINEFTEGRWSGVQPVSGPYAAYGRAAGGVRFRYLDASGAELGAPVDIRRLALIRLVIRGAAAGPPTHRLTSSDSAVVVVALRNRVR